MQYSRRFPKPTAWLFSDLEPSCGSCVAMYCFLRVGYQTVGGDQTITSKTLVHNNLLTPSINVKDSCPKLVLDANHYVKTFVSRTHQLKSNIQGVLTRQN